MHKNASVPLFTLIVSGALLIGQAQDHAKQTPAKSPPSTQKANPHGEGTHTHAAAAKISNPVKPTEASIATGEKLYATHCAACHGPKGAGDGVQAAKFTPRPSDLSDAQWKHGPSDGEIFTVIRNGVPKTSMSAFGKKMTQGDTWDVVNFLRSFGPKNAQPHAH
jgi:mono/diheme cytochrome c family protein